MHIGGIPAGKGSDMNDNNYNDITERILNRLDQYNEQKAVRKKKIALAAVLVAAVVLVSLLSVGVFAMMTAPWADDPENGFGDAVTSARDAVPFTRDTVDEQPVTCPYQYTQEQLIREIFDGSQPASEPIDTTTLAPGAKTPVKALRQASRSLIGKHIRIIPSDSDKVMVFEYFSQKTVAVLICGSSDAECAMIVGRLGIIVNGNFSWPFTDYMIVESVYIIDFFDYMYPLNAMLAEETTDSAVITINAKGYCFFTDDGAPGFYTCKSEAVSSALDDVYARFPFYAYLVSRPYQTLTFKTTEGDPSEKSCLTGAQLMIPTDATLANGFIPALFRFDIDPTSIDTDAIFELRADDGESIFSFSGEDIIGSIDGTAGEDPSDLSYSLVVEIPADVFDGEHGNHTFWILTGRVGGDSMNHLGHCTVDYSIANEKITFGIS